MIVIKNSRVSSNKIVTFLQGRKQILPNPICNTQVVSSQTEASEANFLYPDFFPYSLLILFCRAFLQSSMIHTYSKQIVQILVFPQNQRKCCKRIFVEKLDFSFKKLEKGSRFTLIGEGRQLTRGSIFTKSDKKRIGIKLKSFER